MPGGRSLRDGADPLASRILATALFLEDHPDEALDAWNDVGEPVVDIVNVTGLERTRYQVVARAVGLAAADAAHARGTAEGAPAPRRAAGRADDARRLPSRRKRPRPVDAVILERSLLPSSPVLLAAIGIRAITDRELSAGLASPSGGGELWTAAWRWWEHRPRVALGFAAPAPFGGVWGVDAFGERQTYANAGSTIVETRTRAGFHVSDWTRTGFRWDAGAGVRSLARHGPRRLADVFRTAAARRRSGTGRGAGRRVARAACGAGRWGCEPIGGRGRGTKGPSGSGARASRPPRIARRSRCGPAPARARDATCCFARTRCSTTASSTTACSAAGLRTAASNGADGCSRGGSRFGSLRRCSWMPRAHPRVWSRLTAAGTPTSERGCAWRYPAPVSCGSMSHAVSGTGRRRCLWGGRRIPGSHVDPGIRDQGSGIREPDSRFRDSGI